LTLKGEKHTRSTGTLSVTQAHSATHTFLASPFTKRSTNPLREVDHWQGSKTWEAASRVQIRQWMLKVNELA
jgi:hypothetical protein